MNRRTQKMVKALTTDFGYTEDQLDEFAWNTDSDMPDKYVMSFFDHNHVKKQFIHVNKNGVMILQRWENNQWVQEKFI